VADDLACMSVFTMFTHSCIHSVIHVCMHTFINHPRMHAYIHKSFMHSLIHACMHSFILSLSHACMHTFIQSCIHSLIHAFIQLFFYSTHINIHQTQVFPQGQAYTPPRVALCTRSCFDKRATKLLRQTRIKRIKTSNSAT